MRMYVKVMEAVIACILMSGETHSTSATIPATENQKMCIRDSTGILRKTSVHIIYLNRQFRDKITIDQYRSKDLLFAVIVDKRVSVQLLDILQRVDLYLDEQ